MPVELPLEEKQLRADSHESNCLKKLMYKFYRLLEKLDLERKKYSKKLFKFLSKIIIISIIKIILEKLFNTFIKVIILNCLTQQERAIQY